MKFDHVVLISLDTLRSDCVNYNPQKLWPDKYKLNFPLKTDVLDELAKKSVFFTNCITAAPYTSASHACVFTGKWPYSHGVYEFYNKKLRGKTLFSVAKKLGYNVNFKVDFPVILGKHLGFTEDVDKYIVESDDSFFDTYDIDTKNFSFVHFGGIHIPYGFHNLFYGAQDYIDKVNQLEQELQCYDIELLDQMLETPREAEDLQLLLRYKRIIQCLYSEGNYVRLFELYLEGINYFLNTRFKRFFTKLLEMFKNKNYLLVLFGDHGEEYDADSYGHYNTLAEGSVRIPVIFYHRDIQSSMIHERIRNVDIAPTILELMGAEASQFLRCSGTSLTEFIRGAARNDYWRKAFSQAYTLEPDDFMKMQGRISKTGKKYGTISHRRFKEAVYIDKYKFSRQNYVCLKGGGICGQTQCEPKITIEQFDEHNVPMLIDSIDQQPFISELDKYNALIAKSNSKKVNVTNNIRAQLKNLGYL